jgi:hypothetical protein
MTLQAASSLSSARSIISEAARYLPGALLSSIHRARSKKKPVTRTEESPETVRVWLLRARDCTTSISQGENK